MMCKQLLDLLADDVLLQLLLNRYLYNVNILLEKRRCLEVKIPAAK